MENEQMGARLRVYRESLRLSVQDVAAGAKRQGYTLTQETLAALEAGRESISAELLDALAAGYGVDTMDVLDVLTSETYQPDAPAPAPEPHEQAVAEAAPGAREMLFRGGPFDGLVNHIWKLIQTQPNTGRWASFLLPENMPEIAERFAAAGREWYALPLNFQPASLSSLEVLIDLENDRTARRHDPHRVNAGMRAIYYAAYLGEVICRAHGAHWAQPDMYASGIDDDVLVHIGEHSINVLSYLREAVDEPKGKLTGYYEAVVQEIDQP